MLTPQQLADYLNLKVITIYKWIGQGKIPYHKLSSKAVRFREQDIQEWLSSKKYLLEDKKENLISNSEETMNKNRKKRKRSGLGGYDIDLLVDSVKREVLR